MEKLETFVKDHGKQAATVGGIALTLITTYYLLMKLTRQQEGILY